MEKYEDAIKKLSDMSDLMKYMYIRVGREQVDILHRELNDLTNKNVHATY